MATSSSRVTPLVATSASRVTPLHANRPSGRRWGRCLRWGGCLRLGLSIRGRQHFGW
jgi:hypothetical protein